MSNTAKVTTKQEFINLVKTHCPANIDLSKAFFVFYEVYTKEELAKFEAKGDSSFRNSALPSYYFLHNTFSSDEFILLINAGLADITELVVLDSNLTPTKQAVIGDLETRTKVAEVYLAADNSVYAIGYRQQPKVKKVQLKADILKALLPIVEYAQKKNPDNGALFYHPKDNSIWVVGDDGLSRKHYKKLQEKASDAGFDIQIEAEEEPESKGWLLIEPDGTVTSHKV